MEFTDIELEALETYMEGSLSEKEKEGFENKMQNNKALKEAYLNRLKTKELWMAAEAFSEEKENIKNILSKEDDQLNNNRILWQSIAAAAVLILMIGSYFYINHNNMGSSELQIADKKVENTLSIDEPTSYAKQEIYLEVVLLSPKNQQVFSQSQAILFKWQGLNIKDSLSVFSNDEMVFKQLLKPMDSTLIFPAHKLNVGDYYWQISDKKETFIITK